MSTEHILLGLLREGEGVAARVLKNLEVDIERTRKESSRSSIRIFPPRRERRIPQQTGGKKDGKTRPLRRVRRRPRPR